MIHITKNCYYSNELDHNENKKLIILLLLKRKIIIHIYIYFDMFFSNHLFKFYFDNIVKT